MNENKLTQQKMEEAKGLIKASKKQKKAENMKKIKDIMSGIARIVKVCVTSIRNMIVVVIKGLNDFRQAVNIQIELKIAKGNPKKTRRMFTGVMTVGMLSTFLLGLNVRDEDISIKELSSNDTKIEKSVEQPQKKGPSVASASELDSQAPQSKGVGDVKVDGEKENIEEVANVQASNNEVIEYIVGQISTKFELGEGMGLGSVVPVQSSGTGEIKYGQFSSDKNREDYVLEFFRYLRDSHSEIFVKYFDGSDIPGTDDMTKRWESVVKEEGDTFNNIQIQYKWDKLVNPLVDKVLKDIKVDLNGTLLLQELVYSTVSQYGSDVAYQIIKNSNIKEGMGEIDILNAVQDEKDRSIGDYTYIDLKEESRGLIKDRITKERAELTRVAGKQSINMK